MQKMESAIIKVLQTESPEVLKNKKMFFHALAMACPDQQQELKNIEKSFTCYYHIYASYYITILKNFSNQLHGENHAKNTCDT